MSLTDWIRQPEYTGKNRCIPCTAVNVSIAAVGSVLCAKIKSRRLGSAALAASLGTIYLRGYIIPGTPTLTKRYFPNQVLRWFDKGSKSAVTAVNRSNDIDPEQILIDAGAIEFVSEGTDFGLANDFQQAWLERANAIQSVEITESHLAGALGISEENNKITFNEQDGAFVARTDNDIIGQWSSQAAAIADVSAAAELSDRIRVWSSMAPNQKAYVLMALRIFIEQCPACDGVVENERGVVESCCRSYDVVATSCQNCGCRLFEMEWNEPGSSTQGQPDQSKKAR